jgi:catalase
MLLMMNGSVGSQHSPPDDWEQPRILWKLFKKNGEDKDLIKNLSGHVSKALPEVRTETVSEYSRPLLSGVQGVIIGSC